MNEAIPSEFIEVYRNYGIRNNPLASDSAYTGRTKALEVTRLFQGKSIDVSGSADSIQAARKLIDEIIEWESDYDHRHDC